MLLVTCVTTALYNNASFLLLSIAQIENCYVHFALINEQRVRATAFSGPELLNASIRWRRIGKGQHPVAKGQHPVAKGQLLVELGR